MNSYQKLKLKNQSLQERISKLENMIADEDKHSMFLVRKTVHIRRDGDKANWSGSTHCDDKTYGGILGLIN